MKSTLYIVVFCFCFSFAESQNKNLKNYKFGAYKLNYPKAWKIQKNPFGFQLLPKEKELIKKRAAFVYIINSKIKKFIGKTDIVSYLKQYAETPDHHIKSKSFRITEIKDNAKYQYKITSEIVFVLSDEISTRVEYFNFSGEFVSSIMYQARKDIFEKYKNDAMLIINSIQQR